MAELNRSAEKMAKLPLHLSTAMSISAFCGICFAGPAVITHPKAASVRIWNDRFVVLGELIDPKQIKIVQDAFLRAKRVGDTASRLKTPTHKMDFSDRWLIDINSGEIAVLTKMTTEVYELDAKDLNALERLIEATEEQGGRSGRDKP